MFRIGEATLGFEVGVPLRELVRRDQDIRFAFSKVDAYLVAGFQDRETAARCSFRRGVQDRRRAGRSGLPSVADTGQRLDPALNERRE